MGNNEGLLLCIIITHYYIRITSCVNVIMSSFLHIITYYYTLLHIAAFANTMCELVLTGPRASTPDILDTPDDDVLEPYPQSIVVQLTGGAVLPRWTAAHGGTCCP